MVSVYAAFEPKWVKNPGNVISDAWDFTPEFRFGIFLYTDKLKWKLRESTQDD